MNSLNNALFIQTALRPMFVYAAGTVTIVADFPELFTAIRQYLITTDTHVYVNRGPGSYSGMRTGIAYILGLLNAGAITESNLHTYTSYDLIRAVVSADSSVPVYIKAWPRLQTHALAGSKGYSDADGHQVHGAYESIAKNSIIYSDELLKDIETHIFVDSTALCSAKAIESMILNFSFSQSREPLYINPVHITS